MTIYNLDKFVASLWDWGFLDKCFGTTGIRITDLDGFVERNEQFLLIEGKGAGVRLPQGQIRAYRALAKKGFTIIIIWGEPNKPHQMALWLPRQPFAGIPVDATLDDIARDVSAWFDRANKTGKEVA